MNAANLPPTHPHPSRGAWERQTPDGRWQLSDGLRLRHKGGAPAASLCIPAQLTETVRSTIVSPQIIRAATRNVLHWPHSLASTAADAPSMLVRFSDSKCDHRHVDARSRHGDTYRDTELAIS